MNTAGRPTQRLAIFLIIKMYHMGIFENLMILMIHVIIYLCISLRVASLAEGQSYDCPSASEVTLKDMGETKWLLTTTKHNKPQTEYINLGI